MDLNKSNGSNVDHDFHKMTLVRGWMSLVILLVSLVFFGSALYNLYRKNTYRVQCTCYFRFFSHYFTNPFLLLAVSSLLPVAAYTIVIYESFRSVTDDFCNKIPGYIQEWFESAATLSLLAFSLYLLFYYIPFYNQTQSILQAESTPLLPNENQDYPTLLKATPRYIFHSVCCIVCFMIILIASSLYNMPAAANREGGYGKSGPWCWLRFNRAQLHFWFIEDWILHLLTLFVLTVALVMLCYCTRNPHERSRRFPTIWWDKMILVPFLLFYVTFVLIFSFTGIELFARIFKQDIDILWYVYAAINPLSKLVVIVSSLQLMSTSYRIVEKKSPLVGQMQKLTEA